MAESYCRDSEFLADEYASRIFEIFSTRFSLSLCAQVCYYFERKEMCIQDVYSMCASVKKLRTDLKQYFSAIFSVVSYFTE